MAAAGGLAVLLYAANPQFYFLEAQFSHQAVATALLVALACLLVRSFDRGRPPRRGGATPLLGVGEHGRARDEPPDVTARHRVGDDADRVVGHQPVACGSPIALPARRRRACRLRETRCRSR